MGLVLVPLLSLGGVDRTVAASGTTYTGSPFNFCLPGDDAYDWGECYNFNWSVLNSSVSTLQASNSAAVSAVAAVGIATAAIQVELDAEEAARVSADFSVGAATKATDTSLTNEIASRIAADFSIGASTEAIAVSTGVLSVSTASIYAQLNSTASALSIETTNRISADYSIGASTMAIAVSTGVLSISTASIYAALQSTGSALTIETAARIAEDFSKGASTKATNIALDAETAARIAADVLKQDADANLTDLADGSLTGSKVGSGVPAANIADGTMGAVNTGGNAATVTNGVYTTNIGSTVQAYDADLDDLADGTLSISKVATGYPAANIATGVLPTTVRVTPDSVDNSTIALAIALKMDTAGGPFGGWISAPTYSSAPVMWVSTISVPGDLYVYSPTGSRILRLGAAGMQFGQGAVTTAQQGEFEIWDASDPEFYFRRNDSSVAAGGSMGETIIRDNDSSTGGSSDKLREQFTAEGSWASNGSMEIVKRTQIARSGGTRLEAMVQSSTGVVIYGYPGVTEGTGVSCGTCTLQVVAPSGSGLSITGNLEVSGSLTLAAGAIDTAKLATDSVTTVKILNGAVTNSKTVGTTASCGVGAFLGNATYTNGLPSGGACVTGATGTGDAVLASTQTWSGGNLFLSTVSLAGYVKGTWFGIGYASGTATSYTFSGLSGSSQTYRVEIACGWPVATTASQCGKLQINGDTGNNYYGEGMFQTSNGVTYNAVGTFNVGFINNSIPIGGGCSSSITMNYVPLYENRRMYHETASVSVTAGIGSNWNFGGEYHGSAPLTSMVFTPSPPTSGSVSCEVVLTQWGR